MAIFIFQKDSDGKENTLTNIAASQEIWDANKVHDDSFVDLVTVDDSLFNAVRLNQKAVVSKTGDTVNTIDIEPLSTGGGFESAAKHEVAKEELIARLEEWLKGKSGALADQVAAYKTFIESLNVDAAIPHSFEKHAEDNGVTAVHPLQLL